MCHNGHIPAQKGRRTQAGTAGVGWIYFKAHRPEVLMLLYTEPHVPQWTHTGHGPKNVGGHRRCWADILEKHIRPEVVMLLYTMPSVGLVTLSDT